MFGSKIDYVRIGEELLICPSEDASRMLIDVEGDDVMSEMTADCDFRRKGGLYGIRMSC